MTSIELLVKLKSDFPEHEFKLIEMTDPENFSKKYIVSVDGIMNKLLTLSWEESIFCIVNLDYEDLKKKVEKILQGEKNV